MTLHKVAFRRFLMVWVLLSLASGTATGAVINTFKTWPAGSVLRVCFFGGDTGLRSQIASVASEWTTHGNIRFDFGSEAFRSCEADTIAEVRVGFSKPGYWAFLGTDGVKLSSNAEHSVNFSKFDESTPDDASLRQIVLREFGHVLAFGNEFQSPESPCERDLNWTKVYDYYGTVYKDIVDQNLRKNPAGTQ